MDCTAAGDGTTTSRQGWIQYSSLKSQAELKKLGITLEEAAQLAYNLSYRVLQHNLNPEDQETMFAVADRCRAMFPNLHLITISQSESQKSRSWWKRLFGD
jgi:hypothetical protein